MRFSVFKLGLLASVLAAGFSLPAMAAGTSYPINDYVGSGTVPAETYATVTLTQNGSNVDVDVTLSSCCGFVKTGAGAALMFDLNKASITVGGSLGSDTSAPGPNSATTNYTLNTSNFTLEGASGTTSYTASSGTIHSGGGGDFDYAIACAGCGNGGSNLLLGPLDFTVDNVLVSDFLTNGSPNFGVDLCVGRSGTQCDGNPTGLAINTPGGTSVPEPLTLSLFGAGLVGAAALRRRKKA